MILQDVCFCYFLIPVEKLMFFAVLAIKCSGEGQAQNGQRLENMCSGPCSVTFPGCFLQVDVVRKYAQAAHVHLGHLTSPLLGFHGTWFAPGFILAGRPPFSKAEPSSTCISLRQTRLCEF